MDACTECQQPLTSDPAELELRLCSRCRIRWSPPLNRPLQWQLLEAIAGIAGTQRAEGVAWHWDERVLLWPLRLRGERLRRGWRGLMVEALVLPALDADAFNGDSRIPIYLELRQLVPDLLRHSRLAADLGAILMRVQLPATGQAWAHIKRDPNVLNLDTDPELYDVPAHLRTSSGNLLAVSTFKERESVWQQTRQRGSEHHSLHDWLILTLSLFAPNQRGYLEGYADPITKGQVWTVHQRTPSPYEQEAVFDEALRDSDRVMWQRRVPGRGRRKGSISLQKYGGYDALRLRRDEFQRKYPRADAEALNRHLADWLGVDERTVQRYLANL